MTQQGQKPYGGMIGHMPSQAFIDSTTLSEGGELQSPLFASRFGSEIIHQPNVGLRRDPRGFMVPRTMVAACDFIQAQQGSAVTGLAFEGNGEPLWVTGFKYLIPAIENEDVMSIFPGDRHLNPHLLNPNAILRHKLIKEQLAPEELRKVEANPNLRRKMALGEQLTVGEYELVFGKIGDKEDRNFIPHCHEGEDNGRVWSWIPSLEAMLKRVSARVAGEQQAMRYARPVVRQLEDFKTGLMPDSPPDALGHNANVLYRFFRNAYNGIHLDGPYHRGQKKVLVMGTAHEYSLAYLVQACVDNNFIVVLWMPAIGGLGADSLLSDVYNLVARYPMNVFPTWDWYAEFGPEPRGFAQLVAQQKAQMLEEAFGATNAPFHTWIRDLANRVGTQAVGVEIAKLINMYNQTRYDGSRSLFWGYTELMKHLEVQ